MNKFNSIHNNNSDKNFLKRNVAKFAAIAALFTSGATAVNSAPVVHADTDVIANLANGKGANTNQGTNPSASSAQSSVENNSALNNDAITSTIDKAGNRTDKVNGGDGSSYTTNVNKGKNAIGGPDWSASNPVTGDSKIIHTAGKDYNPLPSEPVNPQTSVSYDNQAETPVTAPKTSEKGDTKTVGGAAVAIGLGGALALEAAASYRKRAKK